MWSWGDSSRRPTPTKALKKMVYERDKGKCRLCGKKVDPLDFDMGHNVAHTKGGKLTIRNAVLLHPQCNRSMSTLTLKSARKKLGLADEPEDLAKEALKTLTIPQLKYLAKESLVKVKSKTSAGIWETTTSAPPKSKYVNALSKKLTVDKIKKLLAKMPKPEEKKKIKKRKSSDGWGFF